MRSWQLRRIVDAKKAVVIKGGCLEILQRFGRRPTYRSFYCPDIGIVAFEHDSDIGWLRGELVYLFNARIELTPFGEEPVDSCTYSIQPKGFDEDELIRTMIYPPVGEPWQAVTFLHLWPSPTASEQLETNVLLLVLPEEIDGTEYSLPFWGFSLRVKQGSLDQVAVFDVTGSEAIPVTEDEEPENQEGDLWNAIAGPASWPSGPFGSLGWLDETGTSNFVFRFDVTMQDGTEFTLYQPAAFSEEVKAQVAEAIVVDVPWLGE